MWENLKKVSWPDWEIRFSWENDVVWHLWGLVKPLEFLLSWPFHKRNFTSKYLKFICSLNVCLINHSLCFLLKFTTFEKRFACFSSQFDYFWITAGEFICNQKDIKTRYEIRIRWLGQIRTFQKMISNILCWIWK